jgi:hypothetical protein
MTPITHTVHPLFGPLLVFTRSTNSLFPYSLPTSNKHEQGNGINYLNVTTWANHYGQNESFPFTALFGRHFSSSILTAFRTIRVLYFYPKCSVQTSFLVWVEMLLGAFSSSAQYVTLKTYFSHPSLSCLFPNLPIKLKLGLQINGRLLIATHLDQSIYQADQKQGVINKK